MTSRFRTLHIDLVGPLTQSSKGNTYIFSVLDRFSRWYEAIPIRTITASKLVEVLWQHWFSRFGLPDVIVSDRGSQFESTLFVDVCNTLGIKLQRTTAYHPAANGMVERVHRTLKNSLRCLVSKFRDWERALPTALLAMRTSINDLGVSPSLVVYGEQIAVPGALLNLPTCYQEEDMHDFISQLNADIRSVRAFILKHDDTLKGPGSQSVTPDLSDYRRVWLKDPIYKGSLAPKYLGPYDVTEITYPVLTIIKDGIPYKVNIDRVKPCYELRDLNGYEKSVDMDDETGLVTISRRGGVGKPDHLSSE